MEDRYQAGVETLARLLVDEPSYRVGQVWDGLYRRLLDPRDMTDLPSRVRHLLEAELPVALELIEERESDGGDTRKWLWRLHDGAQIETVLMHYRDRSTVCVSSQAGCAMACSFCATGQGGFERNLHVGEIVEQVVRAARAARPRRLTNVVFMGMGEPLANYDRVWGAVRRLHDDLGLSARHLTLSTIGMVPGIDRMAGEDLPVNLAVSLHAANDDDRDRLVPLNRRYPLAALVAACKRYVDASGRRLSIEWALIDGVNDQPAHAAELADIARSLRAHVNLIPLNPTPGYATAGTPPAGVEAFRRRLVTLGVNTTVRRNRGTGIDAACGQLRHADRPGGAVTVRRSPTRTASTSSSPASTTPPGHTTERMAEPCTTAPSPITDAPPDADRLATR
ncbi:MAG TPA: 23S rRNA (adenine(2503)-C(2))-methyltransferase RlmN [Acidimicrobiales bacterium]|nr:23S rRNA (adenine(2503)-C(2))-methyltransferase RlmN [Acidimicrobiales bacterium]